MPKHDGAYRAQLRGEDEDAAKDRKQRERALTLDYEQRAAFRLRTKGSLKKRVDPTTGESFYEQVFEGPALNTDVVCGATIQNPDPYDPKVTSCRPENRCHCNRTTRIRFDHIARRFQTIPYGTRAWLKAYRQRNRVEATFSGETIRAITRDPMQMRYMDYPKRRFYALMYGVANNVRRIENHRVNYKP